MLAKVELLSAQMFLLYTISIRQISALQQIENVATKSNFYQAYLA